MTNRVLRTATRVLETWVVIGLGLAVGFTGLILGYIAIDRTADQARLAAQTEAAINMRQAQALCGIFEAVGFPPPEIPEPTTDFGRRLKSSAQRAVVRLGCTPDRTDQQ